MPRTKMNKPELIEQGKRLKLFRNSLKMTQDEFAKELGLHQTSINKYEVGLTAVPFSLIKKLNSKFQMSMDWFSTGNGTKKLTPEKGNLVKDLGTMKTENELVELRLAKIEKVLNKLVTDFYEKKYQV